MTKKRESPQALWISLWIKKTEEPFHIKLSKNTYPQLHEIVDKSKKLRCFGLILDSLGRFQLEAVENFP